MRRSWSRSRRAPRLSSTSWWRMWEGSRVAGLECTLTHRPMWSGQRWRQSVYDPENVFTALALVHSLNCTLSLQERGGLLQHFNVWHKSFPQNISHVTYIKDLALVFKLNARPKQGGKCLRCKNICSKANQQRGRASFKNTHLLCLSLSNTKFWTD